MLATFTDHGVSGGKGLDSKGLGLDLKKRPALMDAIQALKDEGRRASCSSPSETDSRVTPCWLRWWNGCWSGAALSFAQPMGGWG